MKNENSMEISEILDYLDFPVYSRSVLLLAGELLSHEPDFMDIVDGAREKFSRHEDLDWDGLWRETGVAAEAAGVEKMTGSLIFFLMMVPCARQRYAQLGYPDEFCRRGLADLKIKLDETYRVYHVYGTHTGWFGRFYEGTRLLCHCLQCEDVPLRTDFGGFCAGEPVINIHIPGIGPLTPEVCEKSFAEAVKLFPGCVKDGKAVFVCSSWLLARELEDFLPESSNMIQFKRRFTILREHEHEGFHDGWRVYADKAWEPYDKLPRDTALQRGYADHLMETGRSTTAYGAFVYEVK